MKSPLVDALRQLEDGDDKSRLSESGATAGGDTPRLELEDNARQDNSNDANDASEAGTAADDGNVGLDRTLELALQPDVSATTVRVDDSSPLGNTFVSTVAANEGAGTAAHRRVAPSLLSEQTPERKGFSADTPRLQRVARYTPVLCLLVGLCATATYLAYAHMLSVKTSLGVLPGSSEMRTSTEAASPGHAFKLPIGAVDSVQARSADRTPGVVVADGSPGDAQPADRLAAGTTAARAVTVQPDPGFAIAKRAYAAWLDGDVVKAESLYRDALGVSPHQPDALLGLAAVLSRQGRAEEAKDLYLTLVSVDPGHPAAADALLSTVAAGALGAEELVALSERYPRSPELSFALGRRLAAMGYWPEARLLFEAALDQAPQRAEYAFNAAVAYDRVGRYPQAAGFYARALELDTQGSALYRAEASRRLTELSAITGQMP